MPYNTQRILYDSEGKPVPVFFNEQGNRFEVIKGEGGASYVKDKDANSELQLVKSELQIIKTILSSFIGGI